NEFEAFVSPGWISLVHYQREFIGNAAPMHGLGYYDLPKDLIPSAMALGDTHLYVSAGGMRTAYINTPYQDQVWLLVYQREDRLPGTASSASSKDRDILHSIPLPLQRSPVSMLVVDDLLLLNAGTEGVVVVSI